MPPHLLPRLLLALLLLTAQSAGVLCGLNHAVERVSIAKGSAATGGTVHHVHHARHGRHAAHHGLPGGLLDDKARSADLVVLDEHCHACSALAGVALLAAGTGWPHERASARRDAPPLTHPVPARRTGGANRPRAPPVRT